MIPLKDEIFRNLRDFIYEKSGIYIPDGKKYFVENRLSRRIEEKKLTSFEDYYYLLKYDTNGDELNELFNRVTTNETFFFREVKQFEVFEENIISRIKEEKKTHPLKIWSAACSTGEEPYTLAMILMESPKTKGLQFDICASDISDSVLRSAKVASYGQYSMRNVPEIYKKKYFKQNSNGEHILNQVVKSKVKFMKLNLLDGTKMKIFRDMDIIFCRNVLIYFDEKAKLKVINNFYESLRPGGYLFIGMAESLHNITRAFRPNIINKTLVYQKV